MHFQDLIMSLNKFWARKGCIMAQPYDMEVGAGTFHPTTLLKALGPEPFTEQILGAKRMHYDPTL
jgi:glycyl-tRNA synthetase alpha chain